MHGQAFAGREPNSMSDGRLAWQYMHLRQLVDDASSISAVAERRLDGIDFDALRDGDGLALSADECNGALDAILVLRDVADAMEQIAQALRPRDETLVVSAAEIAVEAEHALASGTADAAYVLLAVRMLGPAQGFPALAEAIECDPEAVQQWAELPVGELLSYFNGCRAEHLEQVADAAQIDLATTWDGLGLDVLARIAEALREAAYA
jgi:hypothetical protein